MSWFCSTAIIQNSGGTGYLAVDCQATATTCAGAPCSSGEPTHPIVVGAENERQAIVRGVPSGNSAAIQVTGSSEGTVAGLTVVVGDDPTGDFVADPCGALVRGLKDPATSQEVCTTAHRRFHIGAGTCEIN